MKDTIAKIDAVIKSRQYPFFRLLDGNRNVIVPNKRPGKKDLNEYLRHWDFIKHKLQNELPVGVYILECFYDVGRKTSYDYTIDKKEDNPEPQILQPLNDKKITAMTEEKYLQLLEENSELQTQKNVLMMEVKMLQEKVANLESELSESEDLADESQNGFGGGMTALMPTLTPMLEKYFAQRDRELDLKEKIFNKKLSKPKIKIRRLPDQQEQQAHNNGQQSEHNQQSNQDYQMLVQQLAGLLETDPDNANLQLDAIQQNHPDVYNQLLIDLNLESDE